MERQRDSLALVNFVRTAHSGQTDKCGFDYFEFHLCPVARSVPAGLYYAALAHDILEDTHITAKQMREAGFTESEVELVQLLTKKEGGDYRDYLDRIAKNPQARIIKVMDIVNNLSRMGNIDDEETSRRLISKYLKALAHLQF